MSDTHAPRGSNKWVWTGRILSALVVLFMVGTATMSLINPASAEQGLKNLGYPVTLARAITILEIVCVVIYAIPQTAVLGALLLTAYLGGATASHVRAGEPFIFPIIFGVIV